MGASSAKELPSDGSRMLSLEPPALESQEQSLARPSGEFKLEVHSAMLNRSFNKDVVNLECHLLTAHKVGTCMMEAGWMSPYVAVYVDGSLVFRSSPHHKAHKSPTWDALFTSRGAIPNEFTVAVFDKSNNQRDVLCGHVTIPCVPKSDRIPRTDFQLQKGRRPTGSVSVSWEVKRNTAQEIDRPVLVKQNSHLGHEMDLIVSRVTNDGSSNNKAGAPLAMKHSLELPGENETNDVGFDDDDKKGTGAHHFPADAAPTTDAQKEEAALRAAGEWLTGDWKCIATEGLDAFLVKTGIGWLQRSIATKAAWPSWTFSIEKDRILFVNHAAIGIIKEEIPLNRDFMSVDGQKNPLESHATWIPAADGGNLLCKRVGPLGPYREERKVKGNRMEFVLTNETVGCVWGRTFERVQ